MIFALELFWFFLDPAEIIERRNNDQARGRSEYYVHYEGCKFILFHLEVIVDRSI